MARRAIPAERTLCASGSVNLTTWASMGAPNPIEGWSTRVRGRRSKFTVNPQDHHVNLPRSMPRTASGAGAHRGVAATTDPLTVHVVILAGAAGGPSISCAATGGVGWSASGWSKSEEDDGVGGGGEVRVVAAGVMAQDVVGLVDRDVVLVGQDPLGLFDHA